MAVTTREREWRSQLLWRISGQARLDRFVRADARSLHMTLAGALLSLVMFTQGVVLAPNLLGAISTPFTNILNRAFPIEVWAGFAMTVGALQFSGYTLAWLGIVPPQRRLRLITSSLVCGYFACICTALILGGFTFGPAVYALFVVPFAVRDLSEARRMG